MIRFGPQLSTMEGLTCRWPAGLRHDRVSLVAEMLLAQIVAKTLCCPRYSAPLGSGRTRFDIATGTFVALSARSRPVHSHDCRHPVTACRSGATDFSMLTDVSNLTV